MQSSVEISNLFKSSARVSEANFDAHTFLGSFIAHGTVLQLIDNLGAELSGSEQRTFTVTGPYGSGKSSLALYLSCLLSNDAIVRNRAISSISNSLGSRDRFTKNFICERGWLVVKHLCGLNSPAQGIVESVSQAVNLSIPSDQLNDAECLLEIKAALSVASAKYDGVLIIVDELGKALDFLSGAGRDLHFLQSFADLAQEFTNVVVIGFLHQSFAAYARGRAARTQSEWGTVQGRYKDFSFNPSIEESLYLVSQSFQVEPQLKSHLVQQAAATLDSVLKHFPVAQRSILEDVLPLDPVVGLLLGPISKRSFSQNERSLFSFIATHEKFGFRDYLRSELSEASGFSSLYRIDNLWDYLYHNLAHIISVSGDSKTWLEACDAVDRADSIGRPVHSVLTRLIALLTMVGRSAKLFASKDFLVDYVTSLPESGYDELEVRQALVFLETKSIVIYRHNLNSYQIFRASDLDINRLVLEWIERVKGGVDWVAQCGSNNPILANSHYHRTGTMRWAETQVVSAIDHVKVPKGLTGESFVNFVLPTTTELYEELCQNFDNSDYIVIGKPENIEELKKATVELIALERLAKEESEKLNRDPIAKTEIENRDKLSRRRLTKILEQTFQKAQWRYRKKLLKGVSLTSRASLVADQIYFKCSAVQNELINRMKLSGTANAALNKLMQMMLVHDGSESLEFSEDSFPPEKGIYLSCLKAKGWHTPDRKPTFAGNWISCEDSTELCPSHEDAYWVWRAGFDFIKSRGDLVVVSELYELWMSPPFGLTLGLCKLFAMALLKSLEANLAFYDFDSSKDWIYIPQLDEELVMKLIRYPKEAGVRFYELAETDMRLVHQIAAASNSIDQESILSTARALVRQIHSLPSWVKRTSGKNLFEASGREHLPTLTKRFRDKVLAAKDPFKLIIEDIPDLFGHVGNITVALREVIEALSELDSSLSNKFRSTISQLLGDEPGAKLSLRCDEVVRTASRPEIENFAKKVKLWSDEPSQDRLDELISLLIGVRKESWTDERISEGYDKARELCIQFKRYETFLRTSERRRSGVRPVSVIYEDSNGLPIALEEFIMDKGLDRKRLHKTSADIQKYLHHCSGSEKIQVLLDLLSLEMKHIDGEGR